MLTLLQVNFTVDQIRVMMDRRENIRNMSVIAQYLSFFLNCSACCLLCDLDAIQKYEFCLMG